MSDTTIYMPARAITGKECLNSSSLLVRVIGSICEETHIAEYVKFNWKPRAPYRIKRVNKQSFKIGFYEKVDFVRLQTKKWEHLGNDLAMIRIWRAGETYTEDALDTIPQKALIHNIPEAMWGDEAIGRIASSLRSPIDARAAKQLNPPSRPTGSLCNSGIGLWVPNHR